MLFAIVLLLFLLYLRSVFFLLLLLFSLFLLLGKFLHLEPLRDFLKSFVDWVIFESVADLFTVGLGGN